MASYLDYLPDDVLYLIYTNLDYDGRINLNRSRTHAGHIFRQINKDVISQVDMLLAVRTLKKGLLTVDSSIGYQRYNALLHFFDKLLRYNISPAVYNMNFRTVMNEKLQTFANPQNPDYIGLSVDFKNQMTSVCNELLYLFNAKYPFKKPLSTPNDELWSPVDAGAPHIVTGYGCYKKPISKKPKIWLRKMYI
jgi:hypothetical protein